MTVTIFNIPESNVPVLKLTWARLNKKARKAGMPDIRLIILGTTTEKDGKGSVMIYQNLTRKPRLLAAGMNGDYL